MRGGGSVSNVPNGFYVFFFVGQVESLTLSDLLQLKLANGHQSHSHANANLCIMFSTLHLLRIKRVFLDYRLSYNSYNTL